MIRLTYQIIIFHIITTSSLMAETTGNLLPQQFFNNNQEHNGWTCNDPSHNHGNSIVAARHGGFIENTISLGDTLNQSQMNGGWTSTLGADMWGWNTIDQEIRMTQTITGADGTVTQQIRDVSIAGCSGMNCGGYATYTDSYTQGINNQSNFNIKARFDFSEASQSPLHRAIDLKNPTLVIEHSLLSQTQQTEISLINETVNDIVEQEIQTIEFAPIEEIEEFVIEIDDQQIFDLVMLDDMAYETDIIDDINTGVVNVFTLAVPEEIVEISPVTMIETFEELPITPIETFTEIPMEVSYGSQENIEEIATEIQIGEEVIEVSQNQNIETEEIQNQGEISGEELGGRNELESSRNEGGTPQTTGGGVEQEPTEQVAEETETNPEPSETVSNSDSTETVVASEEVSNGPGGVTEENEIIGEGETRTSENGDAGTETTAGTEENIESRNQTMEESGNERVSPRSNQVISVEEIAKKVNETVKRVDQRLIATSVIVAKAMQSSFSVDNYGKVNKDILNQPNIDGGNYYETRDYIDDRNIYSEVSYGTNDVVTQYQKTIQEKIDNRIRAEEHLRRIRGY